MIRPDSRNCHHIAISEITTTNLKLLSEQERVEEIAEMIGGKDLSDTALQHAKQLLNN